MTQKLSPKRPYFLTAFYEWLSDNELTPYILVDSSNLDVIAPRQYANDDRLTLNIAAHATGNLHFANSHLSFSARFGGVSEDLFIPMPAVLGIFAKENPEEGLFFDPNEYDGIEQKAEQQLPKNTPTKAENSPATPVKKSPFKIIK